MFGIFVSGAAIISRLIESIERKLLANYSNDLIIVSDILQTKTQWWNGTKYKYFVSASVSYLQRSCSPLPASSHFADLEMRHYNCLSLWGFEEQLDQILLIVP